MATFAAARTCPAKARYVSLAALLVCGHRLTLRPRQHPVEGERLLQAVRVTHASWDDTQFDVLCRLAGRDQPALRRLQRITICACHLPVGTVVPGRQANSFTLPRTITLAELRPPPPSTRVEPRERALAHARDLAVTSCEEYEKAMQAATERHSEEIRCVGDPLVAHGLGRESCGRARGFTDVTAAFCRPSWRKEKAAAEEDARASALQARLLCQHVPRGARRE